MEKPTTLAQALEALEQVNATNAKLATDLQAFETLTAEHQAVVAQRDEAVAKYNELSLIYAAANDQITALQTEKKTLAEQANARAVEVVASLGVPPVAVTGKAETEASKTKEELWAEYKSLPISEKNDFYRKNLKAMRD